jgi:hypothetical protein
MKQMRQTRLRPLRRWWARLGSVTPVAPGLPGDGFAPINGRAPLDVEWGAQQATLADALEAWRTNPLARRIVGLTTAYTVGEGIALASPQPALDAFLRAFWGHAQNQIDAQLPEWSDELARSGELFLALFTNPVDGMSYVRAVPAARIDEIRWQEGDYRTELAYRERVGAGEETWWKSPHHPGLEAGEPVLLHYAVNRPVGALRGESDLAPLLPWLRRYARWLEDRVRLNAAVRSFLWVVNAPPRVRSQIAEQFRLPPEPGSVIVADESEKWSVVAPSLHANDAAQDGRAMRWMIAAGGPGIALLDLGEGEDSTLATGAVMQEQKRRFLRRRQRVLVHLLTDLALTAWRRRVAVLGAGDDGYGNPSDGAGEYTAADIVAHAPDISPEDNAQLAAAAAQMVGALQGLAALHGEGEAFRRMALRLFARFAGESLPVAECDRILAEGGNPPRAASAPHAQQGAEQRAEVDFYGDFDPGPLDAETAELVDLERRNGAIPF